MDPRGWLHRNWYIWTPCCCDRLLGDAAGSCSCSLTPVLPHGGVEGDGTDVVSEVVPTHCQAYGLRAALMSSPEWRSRLMEMARLLSSPSLSVPGSNCWRRKGRLQNYGRQCFGQKRRGGTKKNPSHLIWMQTSSPQLFLAQAWGLHQPICPEPEEKDMCEVKGVRCAFLEDLRVRWAKYLLFFHLILTTLLALKI